MVLPLRVGPALLPRRVRGAAAAGAAGAREAARLRLLALFLCPLGAAVVVTTAAGARALTRPGPVRRPRVARARALLLLLLLLLLRLLLLRLLLLLLLLLLLRRRRRRRCLSDTIGFRRIVL